MRKSIGLILMVSFGAITAACVGSVFLLWRYTSKDIHALNPFSSISELPKVEDANKMTINHLSDTSFRTFLTPLHSESKVPFEGILVQTYYSSMSTDGFDSYYVYGRFALDLTLREEVKPYAGNVYAYGEQEGHRALFDISSSSLTLSKDGEDVFSLSTASQWKGFIDRGGVRLIGEKESPTLTHGDYRLTFRMKTFLEGKEGESCIDAAFLHFHLNEDELSSGILSPQRETAPSIQANIVTGKPQEFIYPSGSSFATDEDSKLVFSIDPDSMPCPLYWIDLKIEGEDKVLYEEKNFFVCPFFAGGAPSSRKEILNSALAEGGYLGKITISFTGRMMHLFPILQDFETTFTCQFASEVAL